MIGPLLLSIALRIPPGRESGDRAVTAAPVVYCPPQWHGDVCIEYPPPPPPCHRHHHRHHHHRPIHWRPLNGDAIAPGQVLGPTWHPAPWVTTVVGVLP